MGKNCSKCGGLLELNRINKQRYCKSCHADHMKLTRPKYSELSDLARSKEKARSYAKEYYKRGLLKRDPCEKCGCNLSQFHHEDYTKPLLVQNLCRPCHLELHKTILKKAI